MEEAGDGVEGLRKLRAQLPDAIGCDRDMPNMDGAEFCRCVRRDGALRALPIIIVGGADAVTTGAALVAGGDAIGAKPCSGAVLVATIRRLIECGAAPPLNESGSSTSDSVDYSEAS